MNNIAVPAGGADIVEAVEAELDEVRTEVCEIEDLFLAGLRKIRKIR